MIDFEAAAKKIIWWKYQIRASSMKLNRPSRITVAFSRGVSVTKYRGPEDPMKSRKETPVL
ncbi:MAG TPA: hypothetical protein VN633_10665 [Bryobacteraceae bacterium]|nr:hypothetical protein [Bryobacteraceae bacterium]